MFRFDLAHSVARMQEEMGFLTGLRPYRNHLNPGSLEKVIDYVTGRLAPFGYNEPSYQAWSPEGTGIEYRNLIFQYNPGRDRKLVVGGHYDVCGDQPGADDNGSAVVGLMETARLLAELRPQLDYTVEMVWFCLEEPPYFGTPDMGSYIHAESCSLDKAVKTMAMINYEMIGYFSDKPGSQLNPGLFDASLPDVGDVGDFICAIGIRKYDTLTRFVASAMQRHPAIKTHAVSFGRPDDLAGLSDHSNYWKFGIPALMINNTAMLRNMNYHLITDDYDTIDFQRMADVIQAAWHAIVDFDRYPSS